MTTALSHRIVESPIGPLTVVASAAGVRSIHFPGEPSVHATGDADPDTVADSDTDPDFDTDAERILDLATVQLAEYFAGDRTEFDLALDPVGTPFQQEAWQALRSIPYGATISYGEQADRMGDRRKARAVGAANGRNPIPIVVPCHRVVGADGSLTGFAGGLDAKRWLLTHESSTLPFS